MFQSTRSRRARPSFCTVICDCNLFQSTRSRRARPKAPHIHAPNYLVSIHALAKSATMPRRRKQAGLMFQSTRSRRARLFNVERTVEERSVSIHALAKSATRLATNQVEMYQFQSTRSRRARLRISCNVHQHTGFNPRAREERDPLYTNDCLPDWCFNPRAREERDISFCLSFNL